MLFLLLAISAVVTILLVTKRASGDGSQAEILADIQRLLKLLDNEEDYNTRDEIGNNWLRVGKQHVGT